MKGSTARSGSFLSHKAARTMRAQTKVYAQLRNPNGALSYLLAILAIVVGLFATRALSPFFGPCAPFIGLLPAVALSAWFYGFKPSLLVVVVAVAAERYWYVVPPESAFGFRVVGIASVAAFAFAAGLIVAISQASQRKNQDLRKAQAELENRVRERTSELDSANRSLRELSARLMQLQDDERRRIARELHDSVGQLLVGLTMNLSSVRAAIEQINKEADKLTDSEALVQEMTREVRTMSHLLHPPLLDEAGLCSALRCYVDGFSERSKIKVDLDLPEDLGRLPSELETAVFRVVQECLTNIHRHSRSPVAMVRISRASSDAVRLEVEDKGTGIPSEKQVDLAAGGIPGVGIRGMRERVRQLGGTFEVISDGQGTTVVAQLPVARSVSEDAAWVA
jgi:signal transduction histidine kinase